MSANNKFVVDLGKLTLTEEESKSMNAAIQKAVVGELGKIKLPKDVVILPGIPTKKVGLINGIIIWESRALYNELENQHQEEF